MLRKRKPGDDRRIYMLAEKYLLPFTREAFPSTPFNRKLLKRRMEEGTTWVWVAAHGDQPPRGFINVIINDHVLNIDMLAVDHMHQGRGLGSQLMAKAEAFGRESGCYTAAVLVDESNKRAMQFYFKKGYSPVRFLSEIRCFMLSKEL